MARKYSSETKAAAMAMLLQGQSINFVSKQMDIPPGTLSGWRRQAQNTIIEAPMAGQAGSQQMTVADQIGLALLEYLAESLTALQAQVVAFQDPDWIKKQDAAEIGVLHGILADKTMRILEALANDRSAQD